MTAAESRGVQVEARTPSPIVRGTRLVVHVQREADGSILLVTSDRTLMDRQPGDTVQRAEVWIEDQP